MHCTVTSMITYSKLTKRNIIIKYNNNPVPFAELLFRPARSKSSLRSISYCRFWATCLGHASNMGAVLLTGQFGSLVFVSEVLLYVQICPMGQPQEAEPPRRCGDEVTQTTSGEEATIWPTCFATLLGVNIDTVLLCPMRMEDSC